VLCRSDSGALGAGNSLSPGPWLGARIGLGDAGGGEGGPGFWWGGGRDAPLSCSAGRFRMKSEGGGPLQGPDHTTPRLRGRSHHRVGPGKEPATGDNFGGDKFGFASFGSGHPHAFPGFHGGCVKTFI